MNDITKSKFFTGGNALFTVSNDKGQHHTYRIRQPKAQANEPAKPFFVSLVGGQGSGGHFAYLGLLNPQTLDVKLTKKSNFNDEDEAVRVVRWALRKIAFQMTLPEGYHVQHEGKCCCCGKALTDPNSINLGIGPDCAKRFSMD